MIQKIFTIYDQKAKAYLPPFFLPETGQAKRTFADCCNAQDHQFGRHPADYTLFLIGQFDDSTSKITTNTIESLGTGVEYLEQSRPLGQLDIEDSINENGHGSPIQPSSTG